MIQRGALGGARAGAPLRDEFGDIGIDVDVVDVGGIAIDGIVGGVCTGNALVLLLLSLLLIDGGVGSVNSSSIVTGIASPSSSSSNTSSSLPINDIF